MIIVDAHEDIAYNALCFGRDYRKSALETRRLENGTDIPQKAGIATLGLPDSMLGRVAVVFSTLFVAPHNGKEDPWDKLSYKNVSEAYKMAMAQMDYYQRLADNHEKVQLIRTVAELDSVLATWEKDKPLTERKQGLVLLMENGDPITEPRQFEEWYERGVRIVGPAWQGTRYTGGTGQPGPLTKLGRELLEVMNSFNAILDLSHMAEEAFLEAVDLYQGVIIASHSNPRSFRNSDRHLSDTMIHRLAERDGVMGIVFFNRFLSDKWSSGDRKSDIKLSVVLDAIDYVCQLTGDATHVGIGTDFDGGFGRESIPAELDTVMDLLIIGDALRERGYSEADTEAILGGNMLRKLREALPAR